MSKPIAKHDDGSNCYTKNCKRRTASSSPLQNSLTQQISSLKEQQANTPSQLIPSGIVRKGLNSKEGRDKLEELYVASEKFEETLTREQKNSLSRYKFTTFRYVNDYLNGGKKFLADHYLARKGSKMSKEDVESYAQAAERDIPALDNALSAYSGNKEPQRLFRAYRVYPSKPGGKTTKKDIQDYVASKYKIGEVIEHPAYLSTSADSDYMLVSCEMKPEQIIVHEILSDKGVPLVERNRPGVKSIQNAEKEHLIPRGAKLRVVNISEETYSSSYPRYGILPFTLWGHMPQRKKFTVIQMVQEN